MLDCVTERFEVFTLSCSRRETDNKHSPFIADVSVTKKVLFPDVAINSVSSNDSLSESPAILYLSRYYRGYTECFMGTLTILDIFFLWSKQEKKCNKDRSENGEFNDTAKNLVYFLFHLY